VKPPPHAWFLVGCTATGKTAVSQCLAEQLHAAILSADAMLVYRGMDVGTAKPTPAERGDVPYFGIDLVDPDQPFSTGAWLDAVTKQLLNAECGMRNAEFESAHNSSPPALHAPHSAFRIPHSDSLIVAGGTGLYVKALIAGLDVEAADPIRRAHWQSVFAAEGVAGLQRELQARDPQILAALADPLNPRRLIRALEQHDAHTPSPAATSQRWSGQPQPTIVGLRLPRPQLHARIAARVARMFREDLAGEVRALRARYPAWSATAGRAIGYGEVCDWLDGRLSLEDAREQMVIRTRQLAKRQETWFRHQLQVAWIDIEADEPPAAIAPRVLDAWRQHGPTPIRLR
jgi:tRNA dimethylallyltransferase